MYNRFKLAKKYLHYYFTASNGKGHGIHSPFVFDFIQNILLDKKKYPCYTLLEKKRKAFLNNNTQIEVEDFGAGSAIIKSKSRQINHIAASSLKPKKYAQLLFRIVKHYNSNSIIELGTSLGITTSYLTIANSNATIYTCEGAFNIAKVASKLFSDLQLNTINLQVGDFDKTLPISLTNLQKVDFVFIDGNHRKKPTLDYFTLIQLYATNNTIFVFDDIHWSEDMEEAWTEIKQQKNISLTIDLFFIGIAFIKNEIKEKQHFKIRF